jgi:adenylate cyclase
MNFLCKLFKFGTIFFYAVFFLQSDLISLSAQNEELGLPYIQSITPNSSPDILKYNSIAQDSKGFLFIGGNNGVLRYDGNFWQQLNIQGPISVYADLNGKIIVRGKKDFGFIDYLPDGSLQYTSLYSSDPDKDSIFGNILNIFPVKGFYLLHTSTGIFFLDQFSLSRIIVPDIPDCIISLNDTLLMHIPGYGLYSYYNTTASPVKQGESLANFHVTNMIEFNNKLLIYTEEEGFLIFHDGVVKKFNPVVNHFFSEHGYADGIFHKNGQFILATDDGYLVFYDPVHETILYYYIEQGLPGQKINHLYEGKSGNLWLLHDYHLTRLEWPSCFSFFDSRNGLSGNIRSIIRFNENIYASTSQGIYILDKKHQSNLSSGFPEFRKINNTGTNCGQLLSCGKNLLGISGNGLIRINNNEASLLYSGNVNILYQSVFNPEIVLAGTEYGLVALNISSNRFTISPVAKNLSFPVLDIAESNDGFLWISCGNSGLFRLSLANGFNHNMIFTEYDTTDGLPDNRGWINMIDLGNKILFSTGTEFYYFDSSRNRFYPYSALQMPSSQGKRITKNLLFKDHENNIWLKVFEHESNRTEIWKARFCSTDSFELSLFNIRRFQDQAVYSLYTDSDSVIWIGGQGQLIRFDTKISKNLSSDFSVHIFNININDEYYIMPDPNISETDFRPSRKFLNIKSSQNNIHFNYVSTAFSGEGKGLYQYLLNGYNNDWSKWSTQGFCTFNHLPSGSYTFRVRSQDIFGNISSTDQFNFRISVPVYLRWWAFLIYSLIILSVIYFLRKWKMFRDLQKRYKLEEIIQERTEALIKEKEKSENLLANILPKNIEDELKSTGKATSSKFKMVTVLFADIQGFTKIAEQMNPEKLIDELDKFYFQFDSVVEKFNIEKIKTIGDAYMAAGGIPIKNRTNPVEVVLAALQMQKYMKELKKTKADIWDLRIGIHTGSVIAGVVGQKKFSYDIWGDTVNTASRMESSGEIGKVNVSVTTYELVKDFFQCRYRGKMPVKYKGDIEMYFVTGIKPEFQTYDEVTPNDEFKTQLQILRLLDLEEFIIQKLEKELPDTLYFHNYRHTSNVHHQVELLGRSENVTLNELLLLRSAALFHDIGYIDTIENHETRSIEIAREILPLYRYGENQIDEICNLILATSMPPNPKNLLEKIMCDANLDHLGRVDFLVQSDRLFQEYRTIGKFKSKKEWNEYQIDFLKKHDFFTKAAQKMREVTREQQIENVIQFS